MLDGGYGWVILCLLNFCLVFVYVVKMRKFIVCGRYGRNWDGDFMRWNELVIFGCLLWMWWESGGVCCGIGVVVKREWCVLNIIGDG